MTNPFALDNEPQAPAQPPPAPAPASAPAPQTPPPPPGAGGDDEDPFAGPAPQRPKGPRLREMYGRLLLVMPLKLEEGIPNRLGKPGDVQDRLTADVVILDGGTIQYGGRPEAQPPTPHDKAAEVPLKVDRMFISAAGIISQCRDALAKRLAGKPGMVLGRLGLGEAKGGQNPPYLLQPFTEADAAIARQYLATVDPFA